MDKKKRNFVINWGIGGGAVVLVGVLALCPGKKQEETEPPVAVHIFEDVVRPIQQSNKYIVKKGDYLSKIIYNELGLRGREIYTECLEIQAKNNLGPERDISKVVDEELVSGKDGFVDLIYPGERLNLYYFY